jgi:hypothetical protein
VVIAVLAACHQRTPTARDRVLAELPGTARAVLACDGEALSSHAVRGALDAARPFVPASLGCVVDAAQASDAAALAIGSDGALIAIATRAPIRACPALSQYEPGVWIATVGAAAPADDRRASVAAAASWTRARSYLLEAPLALATLDPHLIAAARTTPLELWLAVDGALGDTLVHVIDAWHGAKLETTKQAKQLVVRSKLLEPGDLVVLTREALHVLAGPPAVAPELEVACGSGIAQVVSCRGHEVVVHELAAAVRELAAAADQPVVMGGEIVGVRVGFGLLGLEAGDVILGFDSHRVTSSSELLELAASAQSAKQLTGTLAVRRGEVLGHVDLRQEE